MTNASSIEGTVPIFSGSMRMMAGSNEITTYRDSEK